MKTAPDRRSYWEKESLPFEFIRCNGDKIFNGEVQSIDQNTLFFRMGNGKVMEINIIEKLQFELPKDRRIDVVVTGKPGHYVLARQLQKFPSARDMVGGKFAWER